MTQEELAKLPAATIEQIKERFKNKSEFQPGLYMRALWVRSSVQKVITTITPLGILHKMFSIFAWFPQRQTINISITLSDARTFMVTDDRSKSYKIIPINSRLKMTYGIFLSSLQFLVLLVNSLCKITKKYILVISSDFEASRMLKTTDNTF